MVGALGGIVIGLVTEYYTAGKPVQKIANSGETGPATAVSYTHLRAHET